jgi:hypothetical protein
MKMTDPWAGEAPSNTGSFLIWQQPHYIYLAEEMYRANPTAETLRQYGEQVEATAEFMADFVTDDAKTNRYILKGATAMQECMTKDISYNHPFELAYWRYGLNIAQQLRKRQGKARIALWDDIINTMFEKHDDYGYDEWLVNGEYGLSYKKFTVNEEQPNEILTADDSSLNPDKAPLNNSIEETPENTMILSLSTGTVISRDDDNSTIDTAQRWK